MKLHGEKLTVLLTLCVRGLRMEVTAGGFPNRGPVMPKFHYGDVIMSAMASQITVIAIVCSNVISRHRSKETSNLRDTGLCAGNSPVTGEFPAQRASNAENVSI